MRYLVGVLLLVIGVGCGEQSAATGSEAQPATPEAAPPTATPAAVPAKQEPVATAKVSAELAVPGIETVREYTAKFYNGELDALFLEFSDEMQSVLPLDQLEGLHQNVKAQYGEETEVVGEDAQLKGDKRGFVRWARFEKTEQVIEVLWILHEDDSIAGFFIRPAKRPGGAPSAP